MIYEFLTVNFRFSPPRPSIASGSDSGAFFDARFRISRLSVRGSESAVDELPDGG
jgi:hypothetical protein